MSIAFEPRLCEDIDPDDRPSLWEALVPVAGMLLFLGVGIVFYDLDPQFPLFWGITFTGLFSRYWLGISWQNLYDGITDSLDTGVQVVLIMFVVYSLIATWVAAGTIPSLMFYGLELLTPTVFLPVTAVLAALVTFAIGSSWTAAGTLGVGTFQYAPYYFLGFLSPLVLLLMGVSGWQITYRDGDAPTTPSRSSNAVSTDDD